MSDQPELLPCPFCGTPHNPLADKWDENGGPVVWERKEHAEAAAYFVRCRSCRARGPVKYCGDEAAAARLWNGRKTADYQGGAVTSRAPGFKRVAPRNTCMYCAHYKPGDGKRRGSKCIKYDWDLPAHRAAAHVCDRWATGERPTPDPLEGFEAGVVVDVYYNEQRTAYRGRGKIVDIRPLKGTQRPLLWVDTLKGGWAPECCTVVK